jgi:hypothetical protein
MWLYSARTRMNDETGHTINCIFYGQDVERTLEVKDRHKIHVYYPKEFSNQLYIDD